MQKAEYQLNSWKGCVRIWCFTIKKLQCHPESCTLFGSAYWGKQLEEWLVDKSVSGVPSAVRNRIVCSSPCQLYHVHIAQICLQSEELRFGI